MNLHAAELESLRGYSIMAKGGHCGKLVNYQGSTCHENLILQYKICLENNR
jgi:hypothetical protein